jgi:hypothetical protein
MWRLRAAILAAGLLACSAMAAERRDSCAPITGTFLVEGTQADELRANSVYFLENVNNGQSRKEGHHFLLRFNAVKQAWDVTVFNLAGSELFDRDVNWQYTCQNGVFVREYDVQGGSEGCSKKGRIQTQLELGPSRELRFTSKEQWEFGALCFSGPKQSVRVTAFPRFEQ